MEDRVLDLLLTASCVGDITVRFLDPYVDVVHKNTHLDSTSLTLIEIKITAVS